MFFHDYWGWKIELSLLHLIWSLSKKLFPPHPEARQRKVQLQVEIKVEIIHRTYEALLPLLPYHFASLRLLEIYDFFSEQNNYVSFEASHSRLKWKFKMTQS